MVCSSEKGSSPLNSDSTECESSRPSLSAFSSLSFYDANIAAACFLVAAMLAFLVSCSQVQPEAAMDDCIGSLRNLRDSLERRDSVSIEQLSAYARSLSALEDSISDCCSHQEDGSDTVKLKEVGDLMESAICRLNYFIDIRQRSYAEFIHLQGCLSYDIVQSQEALLAQEFYRSLDSVSIPELSPEQAERKYIEFLRRSATQGYMTWNSVLLFLSQEDSFFRLYLKDYSKHSVQSSREIVEGTDAACAQLFESAGRGHYDLGLLQAYSAVRIGRRLLMNAEACLELIENGSIQTQADASSAFLAVLAPFSTFNKTMEALRSPPQVESLVKLGNRLPHAESLLTERGFYTGVSADSIPNLLMKNYLSFFLKY